MGFLPLESLREYIQKNRILGAVDGNGELIGYLIFSDYADYFRITQLCVAESHRGRGIARQLVETLQRKATTQKRITLNWYESGAEKKIIAISNLDEVETGFPKDLFKKYQKLGVFEWRDIYDTCHRRIDTEIMALRFSRTFLFKTPISLDNLRAIAKEESVSLALQSPRRIPFSMLARLFNLGFQTEGQL